VRGRRQKDQRSASFHVTQVKVQDPPGEGGSIGGTGGNESCERWGNYMVMKGNLGRSGFGLFWGVLVVLGGGGLLVVWFGGLFLGGFFVLFLEGA